MSEVVNTLSTFRHKRIYIAGPMRSQKWFGFPAFEAAKKRLEHYGWDVVSPADMDRAEGLDPYSLPEDWDWNTLPNNYDFDAIRRRDIEAVISCDAIYMLKGWDKGKGARAEHAVATWWEKEVYYEERDPVVFLNAGTVRVTTAPTEKTRCSTFPHDAAQRKTFPMFRGLLRYFPDALAAVAHISYVGNEQHHPGEPLYWDKSKSSDEEDALLRHMIDGEYEAMAWRALAALQRKIDRERGVTA